MWNGLRFFEQAAAESDTANASIERLIAMRSVSIMLLLHVVCACSIYNGDFRFHNYCAFRLFSFDRCLAKGYHGASISPYARIIEK
mgnify:CR=1 FL=1